MGAMTEQQREALFQRYLASTVNYEAAIRDAGDLPWWEHPDKLAILESRIPGISQMTPDERRRALWERHRK